MIKAIQDLMNEHRLIQQVLGSLETFAGHLERGESADRKIAKDFSDFFQNFVDKCHHGKEEDQLFAKMMEHGFPREYGPLAVMNAEHREGRAQVRVLAEIGAGSGALTEQEREKWVRHARIFVSLLLAHIAKEDNVLYPMAMRALPAAVFDTLAQEFEKFEQEKMGEGQHAHFHALAESLIAAYPPDASKIESGGARLGCAGHS